MDDYEFSFALRFGKRPAVNELEVIQLALDVQKKHDADVQALRLRLDQLERMLRVIQPAIPGPQT